MEADLIDTAKALMSKVDIPLPIDIVVATEFSADATATVKRVEDVADDDMILDVGPETQASYQRYDGICQDHLMEWAGGCV